MAERKITTRIEITGEDKYKQAVKDINSSLKLYNSELSNLKAKNKDAQNSYEYLKQKAELLNKVQAEQRNKTRELSSALENAKKAFSDYAKKTDDAAKAVDDQQKKLDELKETVGESSDEYKEASDELEKYKEDLQNARDSQELCGKAIEDWKTKLNTAETQQSRTNAEIKKNNQYLSEAKNSQDGCATSIDQFGKKYKQVANEVESGGEAMKKAADATETLANITISNGVKENFEKVKEAIAQCIEAANEYESSVAKLQTISGEASIGMLSEDLLELSSNTGVAASSLANTAYNAISAGTAVSDTVNMVESATKLAIAGFTDTDSALSVLTTAINAYGESAGTATEISDSLILTQNLGVTTVADLASNMGKAIATASAYGVNLSNLESAYISTTKAGINTAESTTYLSSMFKELGDDGTEVSKVIQEKTGKSFGQLMGSGETLGNVLQILMDSVNGNSEAMMNLWGSAEAAKGANAILSQGVERFNSNLETLRTSSGITETAYKTMADTAEMAGQRASNAFNNLKVAIGDRFNPIIAKAKGNFAELTESFTEYVKENPQIVDAIGAVAVGLGVAAAAVISVNVAVNVLIPTFQALFTTLEAHPIGLVAIAVTSLVSALAFLTANAEEADGALKDYGAAADSAKSATDGLNESFGSAKQTFNDAAGEIAATKDQASELIDRLESLRTKANKSNDDMDEMATLVTKLNALYPELGLELDRTTGELSKTNDELERFVNNAKNSAMATAYEEKLAEETEAVVDAQKDLLNAKDNLKKADEEYASLQSEYTAVLKKQEEAVKAENAAYKNYSATLGNTKSTTEDIEKAYQEYVEAQNESANATRDLDEWQQKNIDTLNGSGEAQEEVNQAIEEAEKLLEDSQKAVDETTEAYNDYQFKLTEVGDACQETFDKTIQLLDGMDQSSEAYEQVKGDLQDITEEHLEAKDAIQETYDALQEKFNELETTYNEKTESIKSNLESQVGGLDAVELKTEYTAEQIAKNLASQVEYLANYTENAQAVATSTSLQMTDEFLAFLYSGTNEAVQVAAAMNQALSEGETEAAQAIVDNYTGVQSQLDTTSRGMADAATNYSASSAQILSDMTRCTLAMNQEDAGYRNSLKTMQGAINGAKAGAGPYKTTVDSAGKAAVKGLDTSIEARAYGANNIAGAIQGARSMIPSYLAVYRNAATQAQAIMKSVDHQASPSKAYKQIGRFNIEGAILGVKSLSGEYIKTYSNLAKEAMAEYSNEMASLEPLALEASQSILSSSGGVNANTKDSTSEIISNVGSSIASNNKSMSSKLDAVVTLLKKYLPEAGNTYLDGALVTKKITNRQTATSKLQTAISGAK